MQFADPKSNMAFKTIFVNLHHPKALLEFFNAVLELPHPITHVTTLNPYQTPRVREMQETMLDVQVQDSAGRHFIIEMQVEKHQAFIQRVLYYSSKAYAFPLHVREAHSTLTPLLFLGTLNFCIFQDEQPVTRHLIPHPDHQAYELRDVAFNFTELPKFNKTLNTLRTPLDQWLCLLKNAPDMDRIPDTVGTADLRSAYEAWLHPSRAQTLFFSLLHTLSCCKLQRSAECFPQGSVGLEAYETTVRGETHPRWLFVEHMGISQGHNASYNPMPSPPLACEEGVKKTVCALDGRNRASREGFTAGLFHPPNTPLDLYG